MVRIELQRGNAGTLRARCRTAPLLADLINQEIGSNVDRCDAILRALRKCKEGERADVVFIGNVYMLTLRRLSATIRDHHDTALPPCEISLDGVEAAIEFWRDSCTRGPD